VGEHDSPDVVKGSAHGRQFGLEFLPMAGQPGIDHGYSVGVLYQVAVDQIGTDAMQGRSESHPAALSATVLVAQLIGVALPSGYRSLGSICSWL
jgi:hypothetical protein